MISKYVYNKFKWRFVIPYIIIINNDNNNNNNNNNNNINNNLVAFHTLGLNNRKHSLSFQLASGVFNFCQLTVRNILKRSKNDDSKTLYNLTRKILIAIIPPLAITIMERLLKVATKIQFKTKYNKIYRT